MADNKTGAQPKLRKPWKFNFFDIFVTVFCVAFAVICFFPMWYVFVVSITPFHEFIKTRVLIFPTADSNIEYYKVIFQNATFWGSVGVSVVKTVLGTVLSVVVTSLMAYGVSKRLVPGMKVVNIIVIITMYFSGGIIPTYMLYRDIGLLKSFWAMIIPMTMNISYYIIMRNYFLHSLSPELEEAALLDGANPVKAFFRVILPTSAPMVAAVTLFIAVIHWNDWYSYHTYIATIPQYRPLANMLREILTTQTFVNNLMSQTQDLFGYTPPPIQLRMTTVILATAPILIVYPFLQKYFTKGLMLGAVKG